MVELARVAFTLKTNAEIGDMLGERVARVREMLPGDVPTQLRTEIAALLQLASDRVKEGRFDDAGDEERAENAPVRER